MNMGQVLAGDSSTKTFALRNTSVFPVRDFYKFIISLFSINYYYLIMFYYILTFIENHMIFSLSFPGTRIWTTSITLQWRQTMMRRRQSSEVMFVQRLFSTFSRRIYQIQ